MQYIPRFYKESNDFLVLDSTLSTEECLEYAVTHNMNVRLEDTTSTHTAKAIMEFINKGFTPEFTEEEQIYQGLKLGNKVVVNLVRANQT